MQIILVTARESDYLTVRSHCFAFRLVFKHFKNHFASQLEMTTPQFELFEERAAMYSSYYSGPPSGTTFLFRKRLDTAREMAQGFTGRLLECAVGTGEVTSAILETGRYCSARILDLSANMLEQSKKQLAPHVHKLDVSFINSDVFLYSPQDEKFDLILCLGLIAHTGRLDELIQHLEPLLADGGAILLQTSLCEHFGNRIVKLLMRARYLRKFGYDIAYYCDGDIRDAANNAGLHVARRTRYCIGVPFGDRVWARGNYLFETSFARFGGVLGSEAIYLLRR